MIKFLLAQNPLIKFLMLLILAEVVAAFVLIPGDETPIQWSSSADK